jgi:hypothetical protein
VSLASCQRCFFVGLDVLSANSGAGDKLCPIGLPYPLAYLSAVTAHVGCFVESHKKGLVLRAISTRVQEMAPRLDG